MANMASNRFFKQGNTLKDEGSIRNYLHYELEPVLKCLGYLGVNLSFHNDDKLVLTRKLLHSWCGLFIMTVLTSFLLKEHIDIIRHQDLAFDDSLFFYGTTFFYFSCLILPFITLFEIKKITCYFSNWNHYQFQYSIVLKKPLKSNVRRHLGLRLALLLSVTVASAITFLYLTYKSRRKFYSSDLLYVLFSIVSMYHVLMTTLYAILWFNLTKTLKMTAKIFIHDLQTYHNDPDKLEEFRCLWVLLKDLTSGLGNSFSLTFSWVLTFTLIIELTAVYFCINRTVVGVISKGWIPTCFGTLYLNLFGQCAYEATEEVGNKCKRILFDMLSYQKNKTLRDKLKWFIQTVTISPPIVCLSGAMVLNREFNVFMIGTIVAYMVVFFQFKMSEEIAI